MTIKRVVLTIVMLAGALCAQPVLARDANGMPGFLRAPSITRPQFAQPGGKFTVDVASSVYNSCSCAFHIYLLTGDGRQVEVYNERTGQAADGATYRFTATVPADTPPGLYDLILKKGANNDSGKRALSVLPPEDAPLRIMHISLGGAPDASLADVARAASDTIKPDVVLITGVPENLLAEPGRGKAFAETIDRFTMPTIVQSPAIQDDPLNEMIGPAEDVICAGGAAFALFTPDPKTGAAPESVASAITACGPDAVPIWLPTGDNATKFKNYAGITLMDAENKQKAGELSSNNTLAAPPLQEGYIRVIDISDSGLQATEILRF